MPTALSGYAFFQHDSWQLPLFRVPKLGAPAGVNIIFTDSTLYGAWTAICFVASGMTLTGLVTTLGQRNLAAATMATIAGLTMPALLVRWGHMSLMAQFEVTLALIFYMRNRNAGSARRTFGWAAGLSLLAFGTHAYLFAMVMGVVLATIAQAVTNRALTWREAIAALLGLAALVAILVALSGALSPHGNLAAGGFGYYSMNMLSPLSPQGSGLDPLLRGQLVDATGGQYEGYSYLGGGILLLLVKTFSRQAKTLQAAFTRNPWLLALLVGFTLFALSNVVYFGPWKILDLPLSASLADLASMFRSSGRFSWPVVYALTALVIAAAIPLYGRRGVSLIVVAALLQWIDSAPLRASLAERTRRPEPAHINLAAWRSAIGRHQSVRVLPEYSCLAKSWNQEVAVEIELAAAFADRPVNSVYAARFDPDCAAEQKTSAGPPVNGELTVVLSEFAGANAFRALASKSDACRAGARLIVCSNVPGEAARMAALTKTESP
jgi:hypothetical protein